MRKNREQGLQIAVSKYLKMQHPHTVFTAEGSGLNKSKAMAGMSKMMRSDSGLPDMIILEARGPYHGLCIELKAKSPFRKDGTLLKDEHLEQQQKILLKLERHGYWADFAVGFDEAKKIIDDYFKL